MLKVKQEIERKFVVDSRNIPDLSQATRKEIRQFYTKIDGESEERIRSVGDKYFRTLKVGKGLVREETENEITREEFERERSSRKGIIIEKTRFVVMHAGHKIELDVYAGALRGLVVAEVEFNSKNAAQEFKPPAWFSAEVTENTLYSNRNLALSGANPS